MGDCHAGDAPFPLWFRPALVRILRSLGAVSLDALLNLGMRNRKHTFYEGRESIVFRRHVLSVPKVSFLFCFLVLLPFIEKLHRLTIGYRILYSFL